MITARGLCDRRGTRTLAASVQRRAELLGTQCFPPPDSRTGSRVPPLPG